MSHITKIEVEIRSLDALRLAAERCGLVFMAGQNTYKWYGRSVGDSPLPEGFTEADLGKCDHALAVKGNDRAYQVGVVGQGDHYTLLWDFWCGGFGLQDAIGEGGSKLITEYSLAAAELAAQAQGWYCERTSEGLRIYHPDGGTIDVSPGSVEANGIMGQSCVEATAAIEQSMGRAVSTAHKAEFFAERANIRTGGE